MKGLEGMLGPARPEGPDTNFHVHGKLLQGASFLGLCNFHRKTKCKMNDKATVPLVEGW